MRSSGKSCWLASNVELYKKISLSLFDNSELTTINDVIGQCKQKTTRKFPFYFISSYDF